MIGFFRVIGRVLLWMLRTRALRPVLGLVFFVWVADGAVRAATDAAWFASVGMGALWREQTLWATGVGAVFVVGGLAASVPLMRAVARPVANAGEEPPLPRALLRWQSLRARAPRLGWLVLAVAALLLGRGLGAHWSEFALASTAASVKADPVADFWMTRAPALQSGLAAAWDFVLSMGAVGLGAGVLRALPFLAARPSVVPGRWLRVLGGIGVALCVLRGLGFAFEAMRHLQIANDRDAARVVFFTLNGLGALGCGAIIAAIRRPRPTIALALAAVLLLPGLGGDLMAPFVGRRSVVAPAPTTLKVTPGTPTEWPQWDEATLLRAANMRDAEGHIIEWQRAGISERGNAHANRADIVGTPVQGDDWAGHGLTDREGGIAWQSFDLPDLSATGENHPIGPLFYGLNERPLLSADGRAVGVPFQGWFWKVAWAWRLRDPLLLFEGAKSQRLLVMRGVREVGQKLAPFWTWDDVVPRRNPQTGAAYFECVGYSSSALWPRRAPFENGMFAGQNAVSPVAVLNMDARSGAVRLAPFAGEDAPVGRWRVALPALFSAGSAEKAPTPALEVALANGSSLVWVDTAQGWEKKAVPSDLQDALAGKLGEFAGIALSNSRAHLDGATPLLWNQNGELFLAQAFFKPTFSYTGRVEMTFQEPSPVMGIAAGPLKKAGAQWSVSFAGARAALGSLDRAVPPGGAGTPSYSHAGTARPAHDIIREAQEVDQAADAAIRAGNYVQWQKLRARTHALLDELARRMR